MPFKENKTRNSEPQAQAFGQLQVDAADSEYEMDAERAAFQVVHGDQLQLSGGSAGNSGLPLMQNTGTVQRSASGEGAGVSADTQHSIAASRGKGSPLPPGTKQEMEASLGGNFDEVNIHTDENAAGLSSDLQAEAFTVGKDIYFGKNAFNPGDAQGKHILAHELRHTQQQGKSGGEKIQRYVRYYSHQQYKYAPPGENASQETVDQFNSYVEKQTSKKNKLEQSEKGKKKQKYKDLQKQLHGWRHPGRETLIVSNDGKMVVEDVGFKKPNHAWADSDLITKANAVLTAQKSYVKLEEQPNDLIVGAVPKDGSENPSKSKFKKIKAVHEGKDLTDASVTGSMMLNTTELAKKPTVIDDCGVACGLIMGTTEVTREADASRSGNEALPQATLYQRYLVSGGQMQGVIRQPYNDSELEMKTFIQKVLLNEDQYKSKVEVTDSPERAHKFYMAMAFSERDVIDKKYGLQKYARPTWGQGITIANANYSTTKEITSSRARGSEWETNTTKGGNYHYATNIMDSGADYMAFEAYVGTANWYFWMYGEDSGQTFHDKHVYSTDDAFGSGIMTPNTAIISPTP